LLLAQRRPAYYLIAGHHDLNELADQYLRLLAAEGIISSTLRDAALQTRNRVRAEPKKPLRASFTDRKTEAVLRARLATVLGVERLYDLDRIDMVARSTIDKKTQEAVGVALRQLKNPEVAHAMGLMGFRLLDSATDLEGIVYSLILYEHTPHGNLLRVQADTYDEPLDVNEGTKLDLGSTAKLRTMVHYLELIATIYQRYVRQPAETLRKLELNPRDRLSRWVIDQLLSDPELSLASILDAALERSYSASPKDGFFTGGGLHTFANFDSDDSNKPLSVREALQNSVNLVFIRLMRDIVYHYMYRPGGLASGISDDVKKQLQYLRRFADSEGQTFLRRFYYKYRNKSEQERLALLTQSIRPFAKRLATVYRSVYPQQELPAFERFLRTNLPTQELSADLITNLYDKYSIERFDLQDRGYIARIHPLELWLVAFLATHPEAKLTEIMNSSVSERQLIYHWLFKTSRRYAREIRIDTLIEEDAFHQIHTAWKRLGYPFEEFTPSFASAIGASGDRPAALTELLGILMNDGVRYPMRQFDTVHFAANTPYETLMQLPEAQGQRVMLPEVAAAARQALIGVVENGTAQRVKGAYKGLNGLPLVIAGKTGTGDHRRRINDVHGRLVTEQVVSRTAIFAVILGERHFGALTAYVAGPEAARYRFTSALPVQILKSLAPVLEPMIARAYRKTPALPGTVTAAVAPTDLRVRRPVRYKQIHSVSRATKPVTSSRSW
jgi:membrane peptidoglycan carboxypeptidase